MKNKTRLKTVEKGGLIISDGTEYIQKKFSE